MTSYGSFTDAQLIDLLRTGDHFSFTEIYNRYWRLMYSHIYKMLQNEEEAKDILQELFSNLWIKAAQIPEQKNLGGYLYISARHDVLNAIRNRKFRNDYLQSLASFAENSSYATVQYLDERDLQRLIEKEIAALPPRMRQVFEMSRKQNLSNKEIAELLGTSSETVKKQINKSLKILRHNLKESGGAAIILLAVLR